MNRGNLAIRTPIEVDEILDSGRFAGLPAVVALMTTLTLVFDGFDIQAVAFVAPTLLSEWGMERAVLAPVLAASLVGMAIGGLTLGAAGDYIGRRRALIGSMALVAASSLLCASASGPTELTFYRLLIGIGLGGTVPNATALIAEFSPAAFRNLAVTITVVGVPIGGLLGAAIAAEIIPTLGWRSIFIIGAILPALLVVAMLFWLPESPRFLATNPDRWPVLARTLNRLTATMHFQRTDRFYMREQQKTPGRAGVAVLFSGEYRYDTIMVWLIFITNVFAVFAIFNWLPTVLSIAGLPLASAIRGLLFFNLGGVLGSLFGAAMMNRFGSRPVLTIFATLAVATTFATGVVLQGGGVTMLLASMTAAGACIMALQVGMYSVVVHIYPTVARSSGLGWALGIARLGGIMSSFAGSILLAIGRGTASFFSGIAAVLLLTLIAIVLLRRHIPRPSSSPPRPLSRR